MIPGPYVNVGAPCRWCGQHVRINDTGGYVSDSTERTRCTPRHHPPPARTPRGKTMTSTDGLRAQFDDLRGQLVDDPWARVGLVAAVRHAISEQGYPRLHDEDALAVAVAVLRQHNAWLMLLPGEHPGEAFNTGTRATMIAEAQP